MKKVTVVVWLPLLLALSMSADVPQTDDVPANPFGLIGLVGWVICALRKREAIGGWLLYFYIVIYSGVVWTVVLMLARIQTYVPQNYLPSQHHTLLMWMVVPSIVMVFVQ